MLKIGMNNKGEQQNDAEGSGVTKQKLPWIR